MNDIEIIDYRDEFFLKLFRRWYIIKQLSAFDNFSDGVSMQKASFVDFLLSNPSTIERLLNSFNKTIQSLSIDALLYKNNVEHGSLQDIKDFSNTCIILISHEYLTFKKKDGEIFLSTTDFNISTDHILLIQWKKEIQLLHPILSKSISVLTNAVLGSVNGN